MSIVRALDNLDDWTFGNSKGNYLSYNAQIAQDIATRLRCFLGNCFFDISAGIDWFNLLGAKSQTAIELAVRTVILNTPLVTGILDLSAVLDGNRKLSLEYSVTTAYTGTIIETIGYILTQQGDILITQDGDQIHA